MRFEISKARLRKIKTEIGHKIGREITAAELGELLGIKASSGNSKKVMILNMLSDNSPRKISSQVAESALRLEQLGTEDLKFMLEN